MPGSIAFQRILEPQMLHAASVPAHELQRLDADLDMRLDEIRGDQTIAELGLDAFGNHRLIRHQQQRAGRDVIGEARGEGTSNDYLLPEVPALPAFQLQRAVSTMIRDLGHDYWTGTVYTTNRRVWEHDAAFKKYLRKTRCMAIDMETATIFAAGFANHIPSGALLLVSDQPMIPEGVKTELSDRMITANFVEAHIKIGVEALKLVRRHGRSVKHLRFEEDLESE